MTVEDKDLIDRMGRDRKTHEIVLFIFDHLPWTEDKHEITAHLAFLQDKIYRYLDFIESGEIYETYPSEPEEKPRLALFAKYQLNEEAKAFFDRIQKYVSQQGFNLE